jgi:hypothetical protein
MTPAPLRKRQPRHSSDFRGQHPAARAFHAPQRDRKVEPVDQKPFEAPKPVKRAYRGGDNPKAKRTGSSAGGRVVLGDRTGVRGGAKSRRRTTRLWETA